MARGWESKAVEAQQQDATFAGSQRTRPGGSTLEDPALRAERDTLLLSRTRALADLQRACAPAHRALLEMAIAELDERLARLDAESSRGKPRASGTG